MKVLALLRQNKVLFCFVFGLSTTRRQKPYGRAAFLHRGEEKAGRVKCLHKEMAGKEI